MTDRGNVSKDEEENNVEWPVLSVKETFIVKCLYKTGSLIVLKVQYSDHGILKIPYI